MSACLPKSLYQSGDLFSTPHPVTSCMQFLDLKMLENKGFHIKHTVKICEFFLAVIQLWKSIPIAPSITHFKKMFWIGKREEKESEDCGKREENEKDNNDKGKREEIEGGKRERRKKEDYEEVEEEGRNQGKREEKE